MEITKVLGAAVVAWLSAGVVWAEPPAPLPPPTPAEAAAEHAADLAACQNDLSIRPVPQSSAKVSPLDGREIGVRGGRLGRLIFRWGVEIASSDPRVGDVTGLALDGRYGLVATTARADWLTFDLQHGSLAQISGVGVAPIRSAPGVPTGLTEVFGTPLVVFAGQRQVDTLRASRCGLRAAAEPLWTAPDGPVPEAVGPAAYSWTVVVGQEGGRTRDFMERLPQGPEVIRLTGQDLPQPDGYVLQALCNPAGIVPFLTTLWRPLQGGGSLLQQIYVQGFDDVRGPDNPTHATDIARFSAPMQAVAGGYDRKAGQSFLFLVPVDHRPGRVRIYAFAYAGTD